MLYTLAVALYVIVCLFLIVVVLLQPGKGDGMGSAFGGSSTGSVFGGRGASTVLTKMTTTAAVLFMVLSIVLARSSADRSRIDTAAAAATGTTPAGAPATTGGEVGDPKAPEQKPAENKADEKPSAATPTDG